MNKFRLLTVVIISTIFISCSTKESKFTVKGKITDADSSILYLEKRELNTVNIIDSVILSKNGFFKFRATSTPYPDFYVLRLDRQAINLVIDSTETINIESSKNTFAISYNIEGTEANQAIKKAALAQYDANRQIEVLQKKRNNKLIDEEEYIHKIQIIANEYKNIARQIIVSDFKSPAAYFALFQKVGSYLFFDPYNKADYKLFAAVATSWDINYAKSPRSSHLKDYTLIAMKIRKEGESLIDEKIINSAIEINSSDYYKIELPNINDEIKSISTLKDKVILVDFTVYQTEYSPAHNIMLNKIYNKFKPNLEIYQVSFDSDTHFWKNSAINIPWVAVHDRRSVNSDLIFKYNIQDLPTMYLFNRKGEIIKRLSSVDDIESEIQKII